MNQETDVITGEATTPLQEMTDTAAPAADTTAAVPPTDPAEATTPAGEEATPATGQPVTVPVRFRHESRELSMEEAANYAQMGMKLESLQPTMDKLRMMAAGHGQTLEAFVDAWAAADERALLEQLLEKTGGDKETAERLLRLEQEDRQKVCRAHQQQEQTAAQEKQAALTARLATEFGELRQAFPAVDSVDALPETVLRDAVENGRHLLDAYLRHDYRERRRIEENRAAQAAAAGASAGSQADHPATNTPDAATAAMLRGVRSVFE